MNSSGSCKTKRGLFPFRQSFSYIRGVEGEDAIRRTKNWSFMFNHSGHCSNFYCNPFKKVGFYFMLVDWFKIYSHGPEERKNASFHSTEDPLVLIEQQIWSEWENWKLVFYLCFRVRGILKFDFLLFYFVVSFDYMNARLSTINVAKHHTCHQCQKLSFTRFLYFLNFLRFSYAVGLIMICVGRKAAITEPQHLGHSLGGDENIIDHALYWIRIHDLNLS